MSFLQSLFTRAKKAEFEERISDSIDSPTRFRLYHDSSVTAIPHILTGRIPFNDATDVKRRFLTPHDVLTYRVEDASINDQAVFCGLDYITTACAFIKHPKNGEVIVGLPSKNHKVKELIDYISSIRRFEEKDSMFIPQNIYDDIVAHGVYTISSESVDDLTSGIFNQQTVREDLLDYLLEKDTMLLTKTRNMLDSRIVDTAVYSEAFGLFIPSDFKPGLRLLTISDSSYCSFSLSYSLRDKTNHVGEVILDAR